jgi:predicted RNase H-like HicB family nuclease
MIKKSTIRKTAVCWWSDEDESYLVMSPLFDRLAADGETKQAALKMYDEMLEEAYEDLLHSKVAGYDAKGRPAKNGINVHMAIKADSKETLSSLATELGVSQGEIVDWALFALTHHELKPKHQVLDAALKSRHIADLSLAESSLNYTTSDCSVFSPLKQFKMALVEKIVGLGDADVLDIAKALADNEQSKS